MAELFAGANFQKTMQRYCAEQQWRIADLTDRRAVLRFTMNSGRSQTLFVLTFGSTLEFSSQSGLEYASIDDVPGWLSSALLKRNATRKIGFWCLEELNGKIVYSCMHNAEISLINAAYFARVVDAIIEDVDELEGAVIKMLQ